MKHTIHFKSGSTTIVEESVVDRIIELIDSHSDSAVVVAMGKVIFLRNIEFITSEDNSSSSVVTPVKPGDAKRIAEEKRQERLGNPQELVSRIRQNSGDGTEDE